MLLVALWINSINNKISVNRSCGNKETNPKLFMIMILRMSR
jgi:hypothetical protein